MYTCVNSVKKLAIKGQLISKGLFSILEFFQKTNERICTKNVHAVKQKKPNSLFVFGRIVGLKETLRLCLTFLLLWVWPEIDLRLVIHKLRWQVLSFFDHLPLLVDIFYIIIVGKKSTFLGYLPTSSFQLRYVLTLKLPEVAMTLLLLMLSLLMLKFFLTI